MKKDRFVITGTGLKQKWYLICSLLMIIKWQNHCTPQNWYIIYKCDKEVSTVIWNSLKGIKIQQQRESQYKANVLNPSNQNEFRQMGTKEILFKGFFLHSRLCRFSDSLCQVTSALVNF